MCYGADERFARCHLSHAATQTAPAVQRDKRPAQIPRMRKLGKFFREFAALDRGSHSPSGHFQQQFLFAITG